jgi:hypothetical protein
MNWSIIFEFGMFDAGVSGSVGIPGVVCLKSATLQSVSSDRARVQWLTGCAVGSLQLISAQLRAPRRTCVGR